MKKHGKRIAAAALLLLVAAAAAAVFYGRQCGWLVLTDVESGRVYDRFFLREGDEFSIGFIHSVNKTPLIDYYTVSDGDIYVERTKYYGFGAGVQTELEDGQTLTYGEDGSMTVSGFHRKMTDLIYIVGTVSDHTLTLPDEREISLRELCGRSSEVRFTFEPLIGG